MARIPTVPRYRLHTPSGRAVTTIRLPDGSRKDVYLGEYNSPDSRREYARVVAELAAAAQIKQRVGRVRRVLKWAASEQLVPVAVFQGVATVAGLQKGRTAARETEPVAPVAQEHVRATLPHLPRPVAGMVGLSGRPRRASARAAELDRLSVR